MITSCVIAIMITIALLSVDYSSVWSRIVKIHRKMVLKRTASIFEKHYLDSNSFYLYCFRQIPCTANINNIDLEKAFPYIEKQYKTGIMDVYKASSYNRKEKKQELDKTLFVMENKILVVLQYHYVTVLFPAKMQAFAEALIRKMDEFKYPEKEEEFEINIITRDSYGLDLKRIEIKPTQLDTALYYNDDFKEIDQVIKKRLSMQNDKGIVLLHGLPGTGKTTYLRHLVGEIRKKVLFVSPSVAANLVEPEFIDLLMDNSNSVLVIEDAENIMMNRKFNSHSAVSNLLNLSDGLLSDCLNVQIICTFNSELSLIDSALMRKGRLIARYEFGKLTTAKAQALSTHLGFDAVIKEPMTLAEVANQNEQAQQPKKIEVIGFRRQEMAMN